MSLARRTRSLVHQQQQRRLLRRSFASSVELPDEADVVVVGGGSLGASILYHLVGDHGITNAILLEQDRVTAGTTWHSAGMLWRLRPSDTDIQLHTYTREFVTKGPAAADGVWHENGGLFIATNQERLAEYQRLAELGTYFGIESHVLGPSDVAKVHPLLNVDDVCGGLYSPTDGTLDPTTFVNACVRAARSMGGRVYENTRVAGIVSEEVANATTIGSKNVVRRVKGVTTQSGHIIRTSTIVNACGVWANGLAAMVHQELPLRAMKHAFVVTEGIPGMHAEFPNVRDHDLSIYLKTQGDGMAIGGYERNPEFWDTVSPDFAFGLFNLDWETFGQNLEGHLQRCPAIETVGIKSTVAGPESFTPDHKALVGPQPGVRGFFNACGFNSMGLMLGGGMGREVATWVARDSPSLDLFAYDCARFHPNTVSNAAWVKDRTHESYAKTYAIVFPNDEPLAGRLARTSVLHDSLLKDGCVFQTRHGFERPGWFMPPAEGVPGAMQEPKLYDYYGAYDEDGAWRLGERVEAEQVTSIPAHDENPYEDLIKHELTFDWPKNREYVAEECRAAREGVAIFDQSYFGKFFLRGPQAFEAAQYICGADLSKQVPGTITYTPLCNAQGGVEADLTVTHLPDDSGYYFAAGGSTATKDFEWISRILDEREYDATLSDASEQFAMISIQGPHSRNLLAPLVTSAHTLSDEEIPFSTCREVSVVGCRVLCLRLTFVGELGYELHVPVDDALKVYEAIRQAGDAYQLAHDVPVRLAGYRAIDSLSAEKNFRHWHSDLSNVDTPMEAGIGFTVLPKLKQVGPEAPDFLGRAALESHRQRGLQRKLVCLTLDNPQRPLHGTETIWRNSECIGFVQSTAFGYTIGCTIAYGYVSRPADKGKVTRAWLQGGSWEIGDRGERYKATMHLAAPFDPQNSRVKG